MNWPKISVVMPSYNQAQFLETTLRSVLDQEYPNLELIVIDGGSTDDSVEIIKKYAPQIHYWVSEPDGGQTNGLIKGFNQATGDIVCWLNSDDLHEPETLRTVAEFFTQTPEARFVYGNCTWISPSGEVMYYRREMGFIKWIWLYAYNYIPQPASFWKRDLYLEVGGLDSSFSLDMDGDLFARFSRVTPLHHIDKPLARFRFYPEQRNQKFREQSDREESAILNRELNRTVSAPEKMAVGLLARSIRYVHRKLYL